VAVSFFGWCVWGICLSQIVHDDFFSQALDGWMDDGYTRNVFDGWLQVMTPYVHAFTAFSIGAGDGWENWMPLRRGDGKAGTGWMHRKGESAHDSTPSTSSSVYT
jgi:hypothetical protein